MADAEHLMLSSGSRDADARSGEWIGTAGLSARALVNYPFPSVSHLYPAPQLLALVRERPVAEVSLSGAAIALIKRQ